jgi:hypothetical protein
MEKSDFLFFSFGSAYLGRLPLLAFIGITGVESFVLYSTAGLRDPIGSRLARDEFAFIGWSPG